MSLCSLLLWNKRPDSERISTDRLTVEWARISEEVKKQDWPECKFDKPTSTQNLQLTGAKETGTKEATTYQITKEGGETANVEDVWRLYPLRYSKGCRVKTKGELEIGCVDLQTVVANQLSRERKVN